jgi:hypothetical protein
MTDEREEPSNEGFMLDRRDFLQVSLASAVFTPSVLEDYAEARDAVSQGDGSLSEEAAEVRPPPTERRDYFPLQSELVSLRGLAPSRDTETPLGREVWLNDQRLSLRNLALRRSWRGGEDPPSAFDGEFPSSVRELVTPQKGGKEWRRMGDGVNRGSTSETQWSNWLSDYAADVLREKVSSAETLPSGKTTPSEMRTQREALLAKVVNAAHDDLHFRAVGSGHSHSEAARPKGFYTNMKEVAGKLEEKWLRDDGASVWARNAEDEEHAVDKDNLIRLGAGTVLKKLNREILPDEELALPNMGAWDGQTLAGAINTSTHGTGLELGTFADLVRSVEIITVPESQYQEGRPYVRMLRIEPTDGITDPAKFAKDASKHDMGLIQNDDLFHSVVVGYGCMGIVCAYTLELQKPYWLREENTLKRWKQFDPVQGAENENTRHYTIYVDLIESQLGETSNPLCLVRKRGRAEANGRTPTERSNLQNTTGRITESWTGFLREAARGNSQEAREYVSEFDEQTDQIDDIWQGLYSGNIPQIFGFDPPFRGQRDETASYIALRRRKARHPNDPDEPPEPPGDAITTEIGVPVSKVIPAVDKVIEFVRDNWRFFPAPLGVRFTDGSQHFFSPEYDRTPEYDGPTAMLELPLPNSDRLQSVFQEIRTKHDTPGPLGPVEPNPLRAFLQNLKRVNQESRRDIDDQKTGLLDHFLNLEAAKEEFEKLEDILVREFDGRPHMGKHNTVNARSNRAYMRPQNMYPRYESWLDAYKYLNKFETFDGDFSKNKAV